MNKDKDKRNGTTSKRLDSHARALREKSEDKSPKLEDDKVRGSSPKQSSKEQRTAKGNRVVSFEFPDHNDWSWYAPTEMIARQIANIPFNVLSGMPLKAIIARGGGESSELTPVEVRQASVMGMKLNYIPSFGVSSTVLDGITMAANQLYAYVRKSNSGAKNYESPDLMVVILALQEVLRVMFEMRRAITYSNYWNFFNKYLPKELFTSLLNIDYEDLASNRANYVAQYNLLVSRVNTFALPKYFKSALRAAYVASSIFMDSDVVTGQMFAFVSMGYYHYSATADPSGSSLQWTSYSTLPKRKLSDLIEAVNSQIDAIFGDVDAQTMFGDLYKAFGSEGLYTLPELSVDEVATPIFDIDILAQIENASFICSGTTTQYAIQSAYLALTQKSGQVLVWEPKVSVSNTGLSISDDDPVYYLRDRVLNSHVQDPQYTDVLEWTRLMATYYYNTEQSHAGGINTDFQITSCGAELLFDAHILYYSWDKAGVGPGEPLTFVAMNDVTFKQITHVGSAPESQVGKDGYNDVSLLQLDWHPIVYQVVNPTQTYVTAKIGADLKRPTVITEDVIIRINQASNYALYYSSDLLSNIGKS